MSNIFGIEIVTDETMLDGTFKLKSSIDEVTYHNGEEVIDVKPEDSI